MGISPEAIIAIVTLLVSLPPIILGLVGFYRAVQRRRQRSASTEDSEASDFGDIRAPQGSSSTAQQYHPSWTHFHHRPTTGAPTCHLQPAPIRSSSCICPEVHSSRDSERLAVAVAVNLRWEHPQNSNHPVAHASPLTLPGFPEHPCRDSIGLPAQQKVSTKATHPWVA